MAKPIFLVAVPNKSILELDQIASSLESQFLDYHVLVYTHNKDDIEFKAFYEKDFNEIKFQELKDIVNSNFGADKS